MAKCPICGKDENTRNFGASPKAYCSYCWGPRVIDTNYRPFPACCLWPKDYNSQEEVLKSSNLSHQARDLARSRMMQRGWTKRLTGEYIT